MVHACCKVFGRHDVADVRRCIRAHDAHSRRKDDEERHNGHQPYNFRQDKIACRVHAHDVEGVNLLRNAHGSQLRSDVRTYLSGQDKAHD